jgi:hypothetical protein
MKNSRRSGQLEQELPPGVSPEKAKVPGARYYKRGIAASVGVISAKPIVDIVVMSSVHTAGTEEILAGVEGAHKFLRPGGLFVVKAPDVSLGDEGGMDRLAARAAELFGSPEAQGECGKLTQRIDPSLPTDRPASFAIYQKD